jgi:hypothetical protein
MILLPSAAWAACNKIHPTPENPSVLLALAGGAVGLVRHLRSKIG